MKMLTLSVHHEMRCSSLVLTYELLEDLFKITVVIPTHGKSPELKFFNT